MPTLIRKPSSILMPSSIEPTDASELPPLRPYQVEAKQMLLLRRSILLAMVMGSGKTRVVIEAIDELAAQGQVTSGTVFVQNSTKFQWEREVHKVSDSKVQVIHGDRRVRVRQYRRAHRYLYNIVNYASLIHDWDMVQYYLPIDFVVCDECFPAGTLVDTPTGRVPIEQLQEGDAVRNAIGVGTVRKKFKRSSSRLVRVVLSDGRSVVCTPNHNFLTLEGWQAASVLRHGQALVGTEEAMRAVRAVDAEVQDIPIDSATGEEDRQVLREVLLSEVEDGSARDQEGRVLRRTQHADLAQGEGVVGVAYTVTTVRESGLCTISVDSSVEGEAAPYVEGQRQHDQGPAWERSWADRAGADVVGPAAQGLGVELRHLAWQEEDRVPHQLQGRPCVGLSEVGGRGGRPVASQQGSPTTRSQEGRHAAVVRVERVEDLQPECERASSGGSEAAQEGGEVEVFNLEVSGHPSFSVEGLLVHNCTEIKGFTSKRSKRMKAIGKVAEVRVGMSGQPVENKPEELFSIMEFVDPKVLGPFTKFDPTFIVRDSWGRPKRYRNLPTMMKRLEPALFRRSREDIAEYMPKVVDTSTPIELFPAAQDLYDEIAEDLLDILNAAMASGMGGFDLVSHYGRSDGSSDANKFKGMIMSRVTCMRLLCDHPALLRTSAAEFDDPDSKRGSEYASVLVAAGKLNKLPKTSAKLEALKEMVGDILSASPKNKVVIFSGYKAMVRMIGAEIKGTNVVGITGDTAAKARDERIVQFNEDPDTRVFLSSDAGNYGVNLDQGSHLLSYDLPWSAGAFAQRQARIDRLSSAHDTIVTNSMYTSGTIEERQYEMLQSKRAISEAVLDGKFDGEGQLKLTLSSLRHFLGGE